MESHVANRVAVGYLKVYSGPMVPLNEKVQERSITVEKFVFSSLDTMHAKRMQNTCFAGTHPLILGQFPDPALVPFVFLHKTGILLIPDVLSNGLNFASLHGPLISLCGFKNSITDHKFADRKLTRKSVTLNMGTNEFQPAIITYPKIMRSPELKYRHTHVK